VVCTIPLALLEGVRAACARHAVKLVSLQPQLIAAYEAWRHRLPPSNAWFVTVEQGSLAAARIGHHGWDRVHSVRIGSDWTRELKRLQTFGRLASNLPRRAGVRGCASCVARGGRECCRRECRRKRTAMAR